MINDIIGSGGLQFLPVAVTIGDATGHCTCIAPHEYVEFRVTHDQSLSRLQTELTQGFQHRFGIGLRFLHVVGPQDEADERLEM